MSDADEISSYCTLIQHGLTSIHQRQVNHLVAALKILYDCNEISTARTKAIRTLPQTYVMAHMPKS